MKCPTCGNEVSPETMARIYWNALEFTSCMQCFLLVAINEKLGRIADGKPGRPKLQEHNGDDT